MSLDKQVIKRLLARLLDFLIRLERMEFSLAELQASRDIQDLISFRLQEAVEVSLDIAMHIVANLRLGSPETGRDVFADLTVGKVVTLNLAQKMGSAVGFRNLVVHRYDELDMNRLFHDYRDDIKTLYEFAAQIQKFIDQSAA